jgi:SHS2 domain-containing protein
VHPAGHRTLPHTADLRLETWGPSWEACVEQAVLALVESFVDRWYGGAPADRVLRLEVPQGAKPVDVLVAALDEVVYLLDAAGEVPLTVRLAGADDGFELRLRTAPADELDQVGAVPKAVSLHGLSCEPLPDGADGWSCTVTVDV